MSKQTKPFVHYKTYITSDDWYSKHPAWLKAVGYRCTMFPWIRIGKGHRYVVHHMNYKNLGYECLGRDVVPLSPFAHNFVIHGVLAQFKSAGKQGNYPNLLQRTVHFWCNQRLWVKLLLFLSVIAPAQGGELCIELCWFNAKEITTQILACAGVVFRLDAVDEAAAIYVLHFALKLIYVFVAPALHYAV